MREAEEEEAVDVFIGDEVFRYEPLVMFTGDIKSAEFQEWLEEIRRAGRTG